MLDEKLRAGAVAFDAEVEQRHALRKQARDGLGANVLHRLKIDAAATDAAAVIAALRAALASKLGRVIDLFREWDEDQSGFISISEFAWAMQAVGLNGSPAEHKLLFDSLDKDQSGTLEYNELKSSLRVRRRGKKGGAKSRQGEIQETA